MKFGQFKAENGLFYKSSSLAKGQSSFINQNQRISIPNLTLYQQKKRFERFWLICLQRNFGTGKGQVMKTNDAVWGHRFSGRKTGR